MGHRRAKKWRSRPAAGYRDVRSAPIAPALTPTPYPHAVAAIAHAVALATCFPPTPCCTPAVLSQELAHHVEPLHDPPTIRRRPSSALPVNDLRPKSEELLVFSSINQSPPRRLGTPLETAEESDNLHLCGILNSCTKQLSSQQTKPKSAYVIWSDAERMKINRQHHFYRSQNGLVVPPLSNMEVSVELGRYA